MRVDRRKPFDVRLLIDGDRTMTTQSLAPQLIHADAANGQPASKLLVLVHGYFKTAASLRPLIDVLRQDAALKEYDFLLLPYAVGRLRNASPDNLALTLNSSITGMLRGGSNYTTITLLGHSLGGLLVRHIANLNCLLIFWARRHIHGKISECKQHVLDAFKRSFYV
jgi:triacylglycerol esterase/lipase EstA (alpha/beta hydrolase family)